MRDCSTASVKLPITVLQVQALVYKYWLTAVIVSNYLIQHPGSIHHLLRILADSNWGDMFLCNSLIDDALQPEYKSIDTNRQ